MNESFVEVSPSIVMQLNERSATSACQRIEHRLRDSSTQARKPSMVRHVRRIMPAPLLIPDSVTVWPSI